MISNDETFPYWVRDMAVPLLSIVGGALGDPTGGGASGGPDHSQRDNDNNRPPKKQPVPKELLGLELEDGRLLSDVVGVFGLGIIAGSGLRFADGRLVEKVIKPYDLGGFGGFSNNNDSRAKFVVQQRMRKERLSALNRLGFRRTALTGPRGVAGPAPTAGTALKSG